MSVEIPGWLASLKHCIYYGIPVADRDKFTSDFQAALTSSSDYPAIYRKIAVRFYEEYVLPIAEDINARRAVLRTITGLKDLRTGSAEEVLSSLALYKAYEAAASAGVEVNRNERLYVSAMAAANASIANVYETDNHLSELFSEAEGYRYIPDGETPEEADASYDAYYTGGAKLILSCMKS